MLYRSLALNIDLYINRALELNNINSERKLARCLDISNSALTLYKLGQRCPTDTTVIKLAQLANIPVEQALIDLNMWRNSDNPEVLKVYQKLKNLFIGVTSNISNILILLPFLSSIVVRYTLYYVYFTFLKTSKINKLDSNLFCR